MVDVFSYGSYALNGWFYTGIQDPSKEFKKETAIRQPAQTPVFMDSIWADTWPTASEHPPLDLYSGDASSFGRICIVRHGGQAPARGSLKRAHGSALRGSNIQMVYADGHAAAIRLERLWDQYWHLDYVPPAVRPR